MTKTRSSLTTALVLLALSGTATPASARYVGLHCQDTDVDIFTDANNIVLRRTAAGDPATLLLNPVINDEEYIGTLPSKEGTTMLVIIDRKTGIFRGTTNEKVDAAARCEPRSAGSAPPASGSVPTGNKF